MMKAELTKMINAALDAQGLAELHEFSVEHPADLANGDYATNAALVAAKELGKDAGSIAEELAAFLDNMKPKEVERIEVAGPGFINFYLSRQFFTSSVANIISNPEGFGRTLELDGKKVMVEYTDPNPFKEFHIGHLMTNAIGESLSRIFSFSGAIVKRANYQGDVGMHVAKAVWGLAQIETPSFDMAHIGEAYAAGALAYERDPSARKEIEEINKKIYERSDTKINTLYDKGKEASLAYFEEIYRILDTSFDYSFFESKVSAFGLELVKKYIGERVFEESEGAVVFRGEKHGLHTRVFITSDGLPTYEAKELGLAKIKYDAYPYDESYVVTANEIKEYFKVLLKAMECIFPELAEKTKHIHHGMLRIPSGKMSSRTGDVITAMSLIEELEALAMDRISKERVSEADREIIARQIAIAALKYTILKQATGRDIVFDPDTALSFEGDSGPYLQYAQTRAYSVLERAKKEGIDFKSAATAREVTELERMLYRFPETVGRACLEHEPHYLTTYLTELAGTFNRWYAQDKIVSDDPESPYRVAQTRAFQVVMLNGLWLLGIAAPDRM